MIASWFKDCFPECICWLYATEPSSNTQSEKPYENLVSGIWVYFYPRGRYDFVLTFWWLHLCFLPVFCVLHQMFWQVIPQHEHLLRLQRREITWTKASVRLFIRVSLPSTAIKLHWLILLCWGAVNTVFLLWAEVSGNSFLGNIILAVNKWESRNQGKCKNAGCVFQRVDDSSHLQTGQSSPHPLFCFYYF